MRKFLEENERAKRDYIFYLEHANGLDQKSTDKVLAAILKYEESTKFKSFKRFHIEQAATFKEYLAAARGKAGNPLSHATIDATLALVRKFFVWLAGQTGYKSRISYADTAYFKNNRKSARIAHTANEKRFPSTEAAFHAFQAMPSATKFEKRDKALFAFFMLTGARVGAVASLKLKHVDLFNGRVFQDPKEVNTKFAKSIDTTFYPVDPAYLDCLTSWIDYLRTVELFGQMDALFPKAQREVADGGGFIFANLSRQPYANTTPLNKIIRGAFAAVQLPEYTPHAFRTTLVVLGSSMCKSMEAMKAWSMNMAHDDLKVTMGSYLPVDGQRRDAIIKSLGKGEVEQS